MICTTIVTTDYALLPRVRRAIETDTDEDGGGGSDG